MFKRRGWDVFWRRITLFVLTKQARHGSSSSKVASASACACGGRQFVSRRKRRSVSTIHIKASGRHGAERFVGRRFSRGCPVISARTCHVLFFTTPPRSRRNIALASGGTISTCEAIFYVQSRNVSCAWVTTTARGIVDMDDPPAAPNCLRHRTRSQPGPRPVSTRLKLEGNDALRAERRSPNTGTTLRTRLQKDFSTTCADLLRILRRTNSWENFLESPLDIERMNPAMWRGSAHHGREQRGSIGRDAPPCQDGRNTRCQFPASIKTGGVARLLAVRLPGLPGRNAATVMLKDFGTSIEEVVGKERK